jgi:hypothetical protein
VTKRRGNNHCASSVEATVLISSALPSERDRCCYVNSRRSPARGDPYDLELVGAGGFNAHER